MLQNSFFNLKQTALALLVACILGSLFCSGCSKTAQSGPQVKQAVLRITGSDTMVHLSTQWAEAYMKEHPNTEIAVNGGGSGNGIAALLRGTTDIAPSSRNLKQSEKELLRSKKVKLNEIPIALDAIAIVVNPENPIKSLSLEQAQAIFTGKITNWQQLSGPNQEILLYSRESSSGTFEFFQEHVLNKQDFSLTARMIPSTAAIIEAVKQDKNSVGYVGLGYALKAKDKVKILPIAKDSQLIWPSTQNVYSKKYPIARNLYLYTPKKSNTATQNFLGFCKSKQGQNLVSKNGFLPLTQ